MATLQTPFLSFHASGQIAKTVVAYAWKGIDCLREYVVGHDPNTPLQQAARHNFSRSILAWQLYLQPANTVDAWQRAAGKDPRPVVSYTEAYSQLIPAFQTLDAPSFATDCVAEPAGNAYFQMQNMDDGSDGDEPGDFHVYAGPDTDSIVLIDSLPIDPHGKVNVSGLPFPNYTVFLQLVKTQMRSGIHRITTL